jgi:hypothetical protein
MRKAIAEFLHTSYTCLFLVSPEIRKLEHAADDLRSVYAWPCLSLGRELGSVLLPVIPQRRPREAHRWMKTHLDGLSPGPVLCTEIDLLFEPALELDPLRLLCDVGRVARLVVTWPGSHLHDVLAYAVPDHSHYRTWRNLFQQVSRISGAFQRSARPRSSPPYPLDRPLARRTVPTPGCATPGHDDHTWLSYMDIERLY